MKTTEMNVRHLRSRLGMNQTEFWSKIGVTQSGGSRYESGNSIPRPVQMLLKLVHVNNIDLEKINPEHIAIASHLQKTNPGLYKTLQQEALKESA